jgi:photosystem II stability/assembly factor-like uncharacterized protein
LKPFVRNSPIRHLTLRSLFFLLLIGVSTVYIQSAQAQWKQILSAGTINFFNQGTGNAMEYKAGKLWVGLSKDLWMSPDDGVTWSQTSLSLGLGEIITHVCFFDAQNGLVAAFDGNLYATRDGGLSWQVILNKGGRHCFTAAFVGSTQRIVAGFVLFNPSPSVDNSVISVSNDGGLTWNDVQSIGGDLIDLEVSSRGEVGGLLQNTVNGSQFLYSADAGTTWIPTAGRIDSDSYSFRFDACEPGRVFVINEQLLQPTNLQTNLFYSSDLGSTWKSTVLQNTGQRFACGSIIVPDHLLIYLQTFSQGIIRSSDGGLSWKSIGGPFGLIDSRVLVAKDNNTLFAAADDGSIWMTSNSGGDPVPPTTNGGGQSALAISDSVLFLQDSILPCAAISDSNRQTLHLRVLGCNLPVITSVQITGVDASDYTVETPFPNLLTGDDSAIVVFKPKTIGSTDATYTITLADGRTITIKLNGVGKPPKPLTMTSSTSVLIDTLGEEISIPVSVLGLDKPTAVSLTVFYDPLNLDYKGATSLSGLPLDIPGGASPGVSRVLIPASEINLTGNSAITKFRVFADSQQVSTVRFELLTVVDSTVSCAYTTDTKSLTSVIVPSGCGISTISYFMHHNKIPGFTITPNPNSGTVILTTTLPVGGSTIDILDELGNIRGAFERDLKTSTTFDISSLPSGLYFIRVNASGLVKSLPIILQK